MGAIISIIAKTARALWELVGIVLMLAAFAFAIYLIFELSRILYP